MDRPDLGADRMQHHSMILLQRLQSCDHRLARLPELHGQLVDRRRVLTIEEVLDDRIVQRRIVELHSEYPISQRPFRRPEDWTG
jgi:hypothetical protein